MPERLGRPPAVCVPEPSEHAFGGRGADGVDELLPEEPQRDGIEDHGALSGELDEAALRFELQEPVEVEIGGAHRPPPVSVDMAPIMEGIARCSAGAVLRSWGPAAYLRCLRALFFRRPSTFLEVIHGG